MTEDQGGTVDSARSAQPAKSGWRCGPYSDPERYTLSQVVSSGGEGQLWRATVNVDGRDLPIAIKVLHKSESSDEDWVHRSERQAELLRSLDHSGLIRVREFFIGPEAHSPGEANTTTRSIFLVMNWAEGRSLHDLISEGALPVSDRVAVFHQISEAVAYLLSGRDTNGEAVIHRDIKPSNVIVHDGRAKLVDFGFVRFVGEARTVVGTPGFMAPEVARGGEATEATDLYSLGALGYLLLTGTTPVTVQRDALVLALRGHVGVGDEERLAGLIVSLLATDPAERLRAFRAVYTTSAAPTPPPGTRVPTVETVRTIAHVPTPTAVPGAAPDPIPVPDIGAYAYRSDEATSARGGGVLTKVAIGLLTVAVGVATAAAVVLLGNRDPDPGGEFALPQVLGRTCDEVTAALGQYSINVKCTADETGLHNPPGVVIRGPQEGTRVDRGDTIQVRISPVEIDLPDVKNQTRAQAEAILIEHGVDPGRISFAPSNAQSTAVVTAQSPEPGPYDRRSGGVVRLTVAAQG